MITLFNQHFLQAGWVLRRTSRPGLETRSGCWLRCPLLAWVPDSPWARPRTHPSLGPGALSGPGLGSWKSPENPGEPVFQPFLVLGA